MSFAGSGSGEAVWGCKDGDLSSFFMDVRLGFLQHGVGALTVQKGSVAACAAARQWAWAVRLLLATMENALAPDVNSPLVAES